MHTATQLTFPPPPDRIKQLGGEGILKTSDVATLNAAAQRVFNLLSDGEWHTATEVIAVSNVREGLRRMREIRGHGYTIERKPWMTSPSGREFAYRLIKPAPTPQPEPQPQP